MYTSFILTLYVFTNEKTLFSFWPEKMRQNKTFDELVDAIAHCRDKLFALAQAEKFDLMAEVAHLNTLFFGYFTLIENEIQEVEQEHYLQLLKTGLAQMLNSLSIYDSALDELKKNLQKANTFGQLTMFISNWFNTWLNLEKLKQYEQKLEEAQPVVSVGTQPIKKNLPMNMSEIPEKKTRENVFIAPTRGQKRESVPPMGAEKQVENRNTQAKLNAFNMHLVTQLEQVYQREKQSYRYRIKTYFGFAEHLPLNSLKFRIENIKKTNPNQKEAYFMLLRNLARDIYAYSREHDQHEEIVHALRVAQNSVYRHVCTQFELSEAELCRAAFYRANSIFSLAKARLNEAAVDLRLSYGGFGIYEDYFSRNSLNLRNKIVKKINGLLDQLINASLGRDQAGTLVQQDPKLIVMRYLEALRESIVALNTKSGAMYADLKEVLKSLLKTFINTLVLAENWQAEANYQFRFSNNDLVQYLHPLTRFALGDHALETKALKKLCQERMHVDTQMLEQGSSMFEYYTKHPTQVSHYLDQREQKEIILPVKAKVTKQRESSKDIAEEQKKIKRNKKLKSFYEIFNQRFKTKVRKARVGMIDPYDKWSLYANYLNKLAMAVKFIPYGGEAVSAALEVSAAASDYLGRQQQIAINSATVDAFTNAHLKLTAEYVARKMTEMLEQQILLLDESQLEQVATLLIDRMLKAEADVRFAEHFQKGALNFARALCESVFIADYQQGFLDYFSCSLVAKKDNRGILPEQGLKFEQLLKTGMFVEAQDGTVQYYSGLGCEPGKYGFIRGTPALVRKLGLIPLDESCVEKYAHEYRKRSGLRRGEKSVFPESQLKFSGLGTPCLEDLEELKQEIEQLKQQLPKVQAPTAVIAKEQIGESKLARPVPTVAIATELTQNQEELKKQVELLKEEVASYRNLEQRLRLLEGRLTVGSEREAVRSRNTPSRAMTFYQESPMMR